MNGADVRAYLWVSVKNVLDRYTALSFGMSRVDQKNETAVKTYCCGMLVSNTI